MFIPALLFLSSYILIPPFWCKAIRHSSQFIEYDFHLCGEISWRVENRLWNQQTWPPSSPRFPADLWLVGGNYHWSIVLQNDKSIVFLNFLWVSRVSPLPPTPPPKKKKKKKRQYGKPHCLGRLTLSLVCIVNNIEQNRGYEKNVYSTKSVQTILTIQFLNLLALGWSNPGSLPGDVRNRTHTRQHTHNFGKW